MLDRSNGRGQKKYTPWKFRMGLGRGVNYCYEITVECETYTGL
jgi:hypothetical protein